MYFKTKSPLWCMVVLGTLCGGNARAATAVRVDFTLNTTDANGAPIAEDRYYYVYRPDGYPKSTPLPMILIMEASPNSGPASFLNAKAAQVGFVVVSCSFSGNYTGTPGTVWNNDNPRITGWEDFDYITEVINQVKASDNCNDAFITGISKGGHMTFAYACERPTMIKAAGPLDEFMGLTSNLPSAPVPIIVFQGTADANVPYAMVKDSVDAWLAMDSLLDATPITTYEASPLIPGKVTQTTWRGGINGTRVAYVTIIGGTHTYPTPTVQTGYNIADGLWAFFSQYLTSQQSAPKIVSPPVTNMQYSSQPASFWVSATGNLPMNYQWQKNGTNLPGATSHWYTTPPTTITDNGTTYRAMVSNSWGCVTSAPATLTVIASPTDPLISVQPANQVVKAGQPANFTVTASGTGPLRYQWLKNGVSIAGAISNVLSIPTAIAPDNGATFRAVVSNSLGTVTSTPATLTVNPASGAPIIITQPIRSRVLVGQAASFTVNAWGQSPMSYQWQKGTFAGLLTNIPGANAATYTIPSPTLTDHTTLFRCVVSNSAGNATSANEMLFVTSAAKAPTDITSYITVFAQVGVPFSYTITSSGGTIPVTFNASPLPSGLTVNTNTGVISGTPNALGTTSVILDAINAAGSTSATLKLTVINTTPLVPTETWRYAHFGASAYNSAIAGDQADPDGDGVKNLLEYAAGTDPLLTDKPSWNCALENGFLTYSMARNPAVSGLTWNAESSADLAIWNATNTSVLQNTNSLFKTRDNFTTPANSRRFLRLKISNP